MSNIAAALDRLKQAEWLMRPETQRLLAMLDGPQGRTRAVGGIVRDTLLDLPRDKSDVDFATELTPDEVGRRAARAGVAVYPTGIEHGTLTLRLDLLTVEVTTLREDVETDGRHALVRFGTDWTGDASRRDFTFNALYAGMDGSLFDPLGGLADCLARRVRFIGSPERRIAEDRLRVYRFFRFSASHAAEKYDPEGLEAAVTAAPTLGQLAAERVGVEMRRMLDLPRVARTLKLMIEAEILALPVEAAPILAAYEQRARRPNQTARLAILLHFHDLEALQLLWRLSNDDMRIAEAVLTVARMLGDFQLNAAAYRHPAALSDGIEVAAALYNWGEAAELAVRDQLQRLDIPRFPLTGRDLIMAGMTPGPLLGAELERLESLWIAAGFALDRQALLELLQR